MAKSKTRKKNKKRAKQIDYSQFANKFKMSEIILEYAKPMLEKATSLEDEYSSISYATILWNMSFLSQEENEQVKLQTHMSIKNMGSLFLDDSIEFMEKMLERRKKEFSHVNRIIADYEIIPDGVDYNLIIASNEINL